MKLLENNIGEYFYDLMVQKRKFLNKTQKAQIKGTDY